MLVVHVPTHLSCDTLPGCYMTVCKSPKLVLSERLESKDMVRHFIPQYTGTCYGPC